MKIVASDVGVADVDPVEASVTSVVTVTNAVRGIALVSIVVEVGGGHPSMEKPL